MFSESSWGRKIELSLSFSQYEPLKRFACTAVSSDLCSSDRVPSVLGLKADVWVELNVPLLAEQPRDETSNSQAAVPARAFIINPSYSSLVRQQVLSWNGICYRRAPAGLLSLGAADLLQQCARLSAGTLGAAVFWGS